MWAPQVVQVVSNPAMRKKVMVVIIPAPICRLTPLRARDDTAGSMANAMAKDSTNGAISGKMARPMGMHSKMIKMGRMELSNCFMSAPCRVNWRLILNEQIKCT